MNRSRGSGKVRLARVVAVMGALLFGTSSCEPGGGPSTKDDEEVGRQQAALEGKAVPFDSLPVSKAPDDLYVQALRTPTKAGENVVIHARLPPTQDARLRKSLVRVVGEPRNPLVLFQSDALVQAGILPQSPGKGFFSTFAKFDATALDERARMEELVNSGRFGEPTDERHVFNGRHPVAVGPGIHVDKAEFVGGRLLPFGACIIRPMSTPAAWGHSLFVTDPGVVQDGTRTWDPCTGAGTKGGKWTFAHLVREMAQGSGFTPEEFTLRWLSRWLTAYNVNSDGPSALRAPTMVNFVLKPWATASGRTLTSSCGSFGPCTISLSGPLDLDIAPFRLMAIVNRIDLGDTMNHRGYGGRVTDQPANAGELRFVFTVVKPNPWGAGTEKTCGIMPFNTIFEYGVPIDGCRETVAWAKRWTELNTYSSFPADYKAKLESITESVVLHGAAPFKGNQSALNQIRTNEIALSDDWELRQFTLTDENPSSGTDNPSDGLLRPHTVSQTINRLLITGPNATVDSYVANVVVPSLSTPVGPLPDNCTASYEVPYSYLGAPFRGGRAMLIAGHTETTSAVSPAEICARHQLSLNTCEGCHQGDTATPFVHVRPGLIPAKLSSFLTGTASGGGAFSVPDTQVGSPDWPFADLDRRFQRLYDIAGCTECVASLPFKSDILARISQLAGVVPIDPGGPVEVNFKVGPIEDLTTMRNVFNARPDFVNTGSARDVQVGFVRAGEFRAH